MRASRPILPPQTTMPISPRQARLSSTSNPSPTVRLSLQGRRLPRTPGSYLEPGCSYERRTNFSILVIQSAFYKTFGRPIAKVLLVAMLTYQIVYLLWVKLESEETKNLRKSLCRHTPLTTMTLRK